MVRVSETGEGSGDDETVFVWSDRCWVVFIGACVERCDLPPLTHNPHPTFPARCRVCWWRLVKYVTLFAVPMPRDGRSGLSSRRARRWRSATAPPSPSSSCRSATTPGSSSPTGEPASQPAGGRRQIDRWMGFPSLLFCSPWRRVLFFLAAVPPPGRGVLVVGACVDRWGSPCCRVCGVCRVLFFCSCRLRDGDGDGDGDADGERAVPKVLRVYVLPHRCGTNRSDPPRHVSVALLLFSSYGVNHRRYPLVFVPSSHPPLCTLCRRPLNIVVLFAVATRTSPATCSPERWSRPASATPWSGTSTSCPTEACRGPLARPSTTCSGTVRGGVEAGGGGGRGRRQGEKGTENMCMYM